MKINGDSNMRSKSSMMKSKECRLKLKKRRPAMLFKRKITRLISLSRLTSVIVSSVELSRRRCMKKELPNLLSLNIQDASKIRSQLMPRFCNNGRLKAAISIELLDLIVTSSEL